MDKMSKKDRMIKVYNVLKENGHIHSQVDLAKAVGASEATISKALKGDERSLTDSLLKRINKTFGNIFSLDWLVEGIGQMMCGSSSDPNAPFNTNGSDNTNGDTSQDTLVLENKMLKKLLEEKERTIQLLLSQRENVT